MAGGCGRWAVGSGGEEREKVERDAAHVGAKTGLGQLLYSMFDVMTG